MRGPVTLSDPAGNGTPAVAMHAVAVVLATQCRVQETLHFLVGVRYRQPASIRTARRRLLESRFVRRRRCDSERSRARSKAAAPFCWLNRVRLYPLESEPRHDVLRLSFFEEADEPRQQTASLVHLVAGNLGRSARYSCKASRSVVHRAPPGHGRASRRSAPISTRA